MKKTKKVLVLVLVISILFSVGGCSTSTGKVYTQEDIDRLKLYAQTIYVYDMLASLNNILLLDLDIFSDMYDKSPEYLKKSLNDIESRRENFSNSFDKVANLMMTDLGKEIDMTGINGILDNLDKTITFLEESHPELKQYIETGDINDYDATRLITSKSIYTEFLLDNYSTSIDEKLELFKKISNY